MNKEQHREALINAITENLDDLQDQIEIIRGDLQDGYMKKAYDDTEYLQRVSVGTVGLVSGLVLIETMELTGGFEK